MSVILATIETVNETTFHLKSGLHAVYGFPWIELVFYTLNFPQREILLECIYYSLTKLPSQCLVPKQFLDIYVRNRDCTKLTLFEMRKGLICNERQLR